MFASARDGAGSPPLIAEGFFSYQIGGSEKVSFDLAVAYRERGYRVACFAFYDSDGPFRQQLIDRGVECVDLDYTRRPKGLRRLSYQVEMYQFLRRRRVQGLHVHHATALVLCGIPAKLAGVRQVLMTEHAIHQLQERPDYRRQATRYCGFASAITGVHAGITDYFRDEMAVPQDRLHVIPNGVRPVQRDPQLSARLRDALSLPQNSVVALYVGRLEEVKDLRTLIAGAGAAMRTDTRLRLVLAGDGSERARIEALCGELGVADRVHFLGMRQDVRDLLQVADIFAMSSRTEGLPMAMIEAMSAALPCVSTAVGGIPELLADGHGVLTPPGQPQALAAALTSLAQDEASRRAIGERAQRKVSALYGLDAVVTRYLSLMNLPPRWNKA